MHIFNHAESGIPQPQELAKEWYCELHGINSRECYHRCKIKAVCMFGITYRPYSSWGRILKKYLEKLELHKPGIISALIRNKALSIINESRIPTELVVSELTFKQLKQPSRIGNTEYFYDTLTNSKDSLQALRQVVSLTETENQIVMYLRVRHFEKDTSPK